MKVVEKLLDTLKKRISRHNKRNLIIALCVLLAVSLIITGYQTIMQSHIQSMIVTLNYEGAKQGLNPDGSRFEILDIKSDDVLKSAVNILGDRSLSVEELKNRITIESKMPQTAIETTKAAIASGSTYSYNPSEFDIYYSQKSKIGANNTVDFLYALAEAYKQHFMNRYSEKNTILEFDGEYRSGDYEYYEIQEFLSDKVNSMIAYLSRHKDEDSTFRSVQTGYSFENIVNMLLNLRDQDIEKLRAYIVQNQIADDKFEFVEKMRYLADRDEREYRKNIQASEISRNALLEYDPKITGVIFIPSIDELNEYYMSRTKTGIDNIAKRSYNDGITANNYKKKADERNYVIGKYMEAKENNGTAETADLMISDLCTNLEKISSIAIMTDNEYVSEKTKDYITFNLPTQGIVIPILDFIKNFVICMIAGYVLLRVAVLIKRLLSSKKGAIAEKIKKVVEDK